MTQPLIRKNPDGTVTVTGVQERILSQTQSDYEDLVKSSQLLTGAEGASARRLIVNNPELSGGVVASLSKYGAVPDNNLVRNLAAIDAQTRAQRELDSFKEAQRISNERFNKTIRGTLWRGIKATLRGITLIGETPGEILQASARTLKEDIDATIRGDINFFTRQPTDPTKSREDLGLSSGPGSIINQLKIGQVAKQLIDERKIDLGAGFFPSEETGAGFAARRAKMDVAAVNVKVGNRTYQRPFSIFDPVVNAITFGNADTGYGSVMTAIGDLLFGIKTDAFIVHARIKNAAKEAERVARTGKGAKAAKAAQQKAMLDAQIEELDKLVVQAKKDLDTAVGPAAASKREAFIEALNARTQKADEYDNIVYNPEDVAGFISSSMAAPAIDALTEITDWKQIWRLGKSNGGRGGFNVEQSKALAAAGSREEVLSALAPYVAKGEVVADVLGPTTAAGKQAEKIINSRLKAGKEPNVVDKIRGLSASAVRKMPYYNKIVNAYSTVVPNGKAIHASDKDGLIDAIYSYGRIANVSNAKLDEIADIVALTDDASEAGYTASAKLFDEIYKTNIKNPAFDADMLKKVTRIFENGKQEMGMYWAARHAAGSELNIVVSKGKEIRLSGPHIESEYLNSAVYFPNPRELLDAIALVNKLPMGGKSAAEVQKALDRATNIVWKRIVLVRPAYILRNIAEEQIRVLGTGHISFFNNPLAAMGMWLGRDDSSTWRAIINKFDPFRNTVTDESFKLGNVRDELFAEELAHEGANSYINFQSARSVSAVDNDVRTAVTFAGFAPVEFGHPRWWEGLANEVRILSNSVAARAVARTGPTQQNRQATVDYLLRGAGKEEYTRFAKLQKPETRDLLLTDEGAMAYLFTGVDDNKRAVSLYARIEEATGRGGEGSQALKNLIAFGKIEGPGMNIQVPKGKMSAENSIRNAKAVQEGKKAIKDSTQELADALQQTFTGKGDWQGLLMSVPKVTYKAEEETKGTAARLSDWFFDKAVSLEKTTTMGPEWRQSYWDAIYDISSALDADAVAKLSVTAKKSLSPLQSWKGEPIGKQHSIWKAFRSAKGDGNMTAQEAHEYASMVASKRTADLFYDASRKRLLFHQLRLIAPFGAAWEDTLRRWSQIALDNPTQVYTIQKGLQWFTKPESSALYSMTDAKDYYDPNQGFFFTDPLDGQRKFFIPFLGTGLNFLSNLASGQGMSAQGPYAIAATPQSLNFAFSSGSIMPGVGPGIQFGVKTLDNLGLNPINMLPKSIQNSLDKIIFPFGEPDMKQGYLESLLPGNWRRIFGAAAANEEAYAAAFAPVMNYLASGGNYNLDDMEDQAQLVKDTNKFSQWFTGFRGAFGLVSPFPLNPQGLTTLDDGNAVLSTALYNDFKQLELNSGGNPNKAYADFMDLYGPEAIFAIINTSTGAPTNLMTYELIQREPEVVDAYPDTYGFAYPNGGFSSELYRWQQRAGKKDKFTPEQLIQRATSLRYYAANDRLMTRLVSGDFSEEEYEEASRVLRDSYVKAGLSIQSDPYKDARVKDQLRRMAYDTRFADSDAVTGLRDYLYLRDKALEAAGITNDSLAKKGALPQREWLAGEAKKILQRNPEFYKFYYRFFKEELEG